MASWASGTAAAAGSAAPPGLPPSGPPPPWSPPLTSPSPPQSPAPAAQEPSSLHVSEPGPGPGLSPHTPQGGWHKGSDPRSSSTQSLVPSLDGDDERRILLLVYIHGFMGDNTSFRSFPAHVHAYLKEALVESHVIHSKIYPRYKTYKAIDVARDNFSKWLEPHESHKTDVVLIGHSMGGLLAADVALMPSPNPVYGHPFKHRILGTISLDAPLLGLHPGIIKSGIASLFRKAPDPPGQGQELADSLGSQNASGSMSTLSFSTEGAASSASGLTTPSSLTGTSSVASGPSRPDPNYNPPFFNDVQFVDRGWWRNVAHFAKKHYSEGLVTSTYQHLLSHLEFGACLADYSALNTRYNRIRRLEDVDELNAGAQSGQRQARVRFVNYYTVSTGIPKKPPTPKRAGSHLRPEPVDSPRRPSMHSSGASTPRISIEDYSDDERPHTMQILEPAPMSEGDHEELVAGPTSMEGSSKEKTPGSSAAGKVVDDEEGRHGIEQTPDPASKPPEGESQAEVAEDPNHGLPEIPPAPEPPETPDFERYTDKDARKQAEKEFKRVQKTYDQAVKNREKALKERQKLVEKRRKKAQKEEEKRQKDEEKRHKEEEKRLAKEEKQKEQASQRDAARDNDDGNDQQAGSQAQVVTSAQTQALQKQLTDLALNDQLPHSESTPSLSPQTTHGSVTSPPPYNTTASTRSPVAAEARGSNDNNNNNTTKKKLHKFCMLPQKGGSGGRDGCWVQVYMEGVDEVGAHCGLFFPGPHYEKIVGDVGSRVVGWVQEDMSTRAILALD